ncbi:MAG: hypothetical protein RBS39_13680 [Phycisphaerales bacterium]|nr:hypothetical protein [Phycisphaerales bacterium]
MVVASIAGFASADVVTAFTFNNLPNSSGPMPAPYAADFGTGTYTTNFVDGDVVLFAGSTVGGLPGDVNGRGAAFRVGDSARNNGRYAQFAIDTTGYGDLLLTFATKTTAGTGFTSLDVQVSGNGTDFTTVQTLLNLRNDADWLVKSIDLTSASVLEDNANAVIRVVFYGGDAANPTANTRLENFIIQGSAVPAPGAAALLGLGGLVATRRRRA